ncbi:MAG: flavodoxin family protein [Oscillospiraceae bacterium]|nr:flavodoxin family protein [Oscillospiraceae bacterium]
MRVILINGSPEQEGCTYTGLSIAAEALHAEGVETRMLQLGQQAMEGCRACHYCFKHDGCVIDDQVNEFVAMAKEADGFIFGSPVHYAAAGGTITSFMDRAFFSARGKPYRGKPAAAIVCCRRGGSSAALDQLHKYFSISQMPIVSSVYWNMIHGNTPEEVMRDEEGVQVMRVLGRNMAWLLKCIAAGREAGVDFPAQEKRVWTNFI